MADHHTTPDQLDPWFRHSAAEGMPQHEHAAKVDTGILVSVFVILCATVLVFTVGVAVYANGAIARMQGERELSTSSAEPALAYRAKALADASSTQWLDRAAGTVQLSVEQATERVLAEYAN
jgi:hypothetical protein